MNILLITNNLYPTGGDWTYITSVAEIYESHGHTVYMWGQANERNVYHKNEEYFVGLLDRQASRKKYADAFRIIKRSIYSQEAYDKLTDFLDHFPIDIVQINSINIGLTPAVIEAIHNKQIPIVWRVLDYKMICPTIHLLRDNKVCEDCFGGKYFNCIKNRCKNGSLTDSIAVALETYINSHKPYYKHVDMMSFQNHFTHKLYERWSFPINNAVVINNPYDVSSIKPNYEDADYVLYFGKTDVNKGVMTLLQTAVLNRDINYVIVGVGSEDENIKTYIKDNNLSNVEFKGPIWGEKMDEILYKCAFVVVPSEWYEPSPYVILQAFAHGKPVMGSRMGGIPEMVKDGYNGVLFEARNVEELAKGIKTLVSNKDQLHELGRNARKEVEEFYSPEYYYKESMAVFESLTKK